MHTAQRKERDRTDSDVADERRKFKVSSTGAPRAKPHISDEVGEKWASMYRDPEGKVLCP